MKVISLIVILFYFIHIPVHGQEQLTQVIRGTVVDKQTRAPLPGASVVLMDSTISMGTMTNDQGEFRLEDVPTGRQDISISFIGYYPAVIRNMIHNSARETVIFVELEEKVEVTGEVTVVGNYRKDLAMNKMASVSARAFTVEETARYAGSREDVARMAMNFAGVSGANDQRNDIIIRGNTPGGILWRLEDVDIPNPNHFAASGTTGGPIGMLNNNTLRNSDFFTGAFPAEYTNAFSGVFDLKMREGNNQKYEFMGQVGFNGFELGAEGPFRADTKSSFLINYRYSTLQVFDLLGISFGTSGVPQYQDLNMKLNFPVKKGKISFFGLAGKSSITMLDSGNDDGDLYTEEGMDLENGSSLMVGGASWARYHSENSYSKLIFSLQGQTGYTNLDLFDPGQEPEPFYREDNTENRAALRYLFNNRFSRKLGMRSGITFNKFGYNLNVKTWEEYDERSYLLDRDKSIANGPALLSGFSQWVYKFSDRFELKPGVSLVWWSLNRELSVEPRIGATWQTGPYSKLNFGYGNHSRIQSVVTYFIETIYPDGQLELTNRNLGFTKTHHWVGGFDLLLSKQLRFKSEIYYQFLYNVPVEQESSSFSMINSGANWGLNTRDFLVNEGEGWNYGLELTLEKFYHKNYYFLTTFSLFDSRYRGSDNIIRNTAFNGNFVFNALAGKEIKVKKNSALVFDVKAVWAGGKPYTPIDVEASRQEEGALSTVYITERAWEEQFPNYFKADVKIGFRHDSKNISQVWEFYVENVTNHKNPLNQLYNSSKDEIETVYQLGLFPLFNYKIYF